MCWHTNLVIKHLLFLKPPLGLGLAGDAGTGTSLPSASILNNRYLYTADLQQLTAASPARPSYSWPQYHTPVKVANLLPFLRRHPDQEFAAYIYDGLINGFRVGFNYNLSQLHPNRSNHPSALAHKHDVEERTAAELSAGRLLGPLPAHLLSLVHLSPIGLVPKAHTNKWRMIVDLSHPANGSVNDGILPSLCSLHYASVDDAVRIIQTLGVGTELVKLDIIRMPIESCQYTQPIITSLV